MNILPKKRWHVRTKENIARVRKDEAEAAEKEKQEQERIENADREARLSVLKLKSRQKLEESGITVTDLSVAEQKEHINLFYDEEHAIVTTNKEHDAEVKSKQEEYEKKIGYLTYLGQDTNESQKKKSWYEVTPGSSRFSRASDIKDTYEKLVLKDPDGKPKSCTVDVKDGEVGWKIKKALDPMNSFKEYCHSQRPIVKQQLKEKPVQDEPTKSKIDKHKKQSKKDDRVKEKQMKLDKLRQARLRRELQEKQKTETFLSGLNPTAAKVVDAKPAPKVTAKYNSQFNPALARQNFK